MALRLALLSLKNVPVGVNPFAITVDQFSSTVYVANSGSNSVSVIKGNKNIENVTVGKGPEAIAVYNGTVYVANSGSNSVSVINGVTGKKVVPNIQLGVSPSDIEFNEGTGLLYVMSPQAISVIKGSDDRVAAGITFNVSPGNSGNIVCNNEAYPTNRYLYIESGTECYANLAY